MCKMSKNNKEYILIHEKKTSSSAQHSKHHIALQTQLLSWSENLP